MESLNSDGKIISNVVDDPSVVLQQDGTGTMDAPSTAMNMRLPKPNTAISDFKKIGSKALYVDKTLIVKDIIDTYPEVGIFLFTRPRRFGKTFLMSTLKAFFEKPGSAGDVKATEDTSQLFRDKKIWLCPEEYRAHQGQYPVVYLTLKEVKADTWEAMYNQLCQLLLNEKARHSEILTSDPRQCDLS